MRYWWCMVCERREANACLIMLSAKQGSHWYHFYNVFGMTRPGIDPTPILTYRTRSGRSTTWAIAAANSIVSGWIWPKFELVRDLMHVLITCKYKKDQIKSNREKVATPFSPLYVNGGFLLPWTPEVWSNLPQNITKPFPTPSDATHKIWSRLANWLQRYSSSKVLNFRHSRASNSKVSGLIWLEIKLVWAFMPVLVTSNFDDDSIKNEWAWRQHFPIISLWETFKTLKGS